MTQASEQTTPLATESQSSLSAEADAKFLESLDRAIVNGSLEDLRRLRSELQVRFDAHEGGPELPITTLSPTSTGVFPKC